VLRDRSPTERSEDGISEPSSHEGSNGDAGLTGDLFGASMRTVSMRVVIVPPRFEGLPTASSQTVPMDGCFSSIVSLLMIDQRFGPTRHMFIASTDGRGPTQKK
jgi:hypothetical protein